jgi:hypothetical protein
MRIMGEVQVQPSFWTPFEPALCVYSLRYALFLSLLKTNFPCICSVVSTPDTMVLGNKPAIFWEVQPTSFKLKMDKKNPLKVI